MLQDALAGVALTVVRREYPFPGPKPDLTDDEADIEEPSYLLFRAASRIKIVPAGMRR